MGIERILGSEREKRTKREEGRVVSGRNYRVLW